MKVLMSAYACEPGKGSEPAVGWNWALQAARNHEVWLLTRSNNRQAIEAALASDPVPNLHFVYHDLPKALRFWKRGGRGIHLYYLLWQLSALRVARRLHREIKFEVGHHVTFVSQRFPSFLAWLDLPFVWGPVAGAEQAPKSFYATFGHRGRRQQLLRDLSNALLRYDPLLRHTARRARAIIGATPETSASIGKRFAREPVTSLAIGWSGETAAPRTYEGPLRLVYVGRLVYWKGVHLALRALAAAIATRPGITLTIVGDGPERQRLQALATELGLEQLVSFLGKVPEAEVAPILAQHNCFVFPSFQDSGAFAVLEAMTQRLPVIALASGGPALLVSYETGIKIEPRDPAQTIDALRHAFVRLHDDPELRQQLGDAGARRAVDEFSWDRVGGLISDVYDTCAPHAATSRPQTLFAGALDG